MMEVTVETAVTIQHRAVEAIEKAEFFPTPWPHIVIRDFLPWNYYAELLAEWPDRDWKELVYPDQKKPDGTYRRKQLMLTETDQLRELREAMISPTLQAAVFEKLRIDRNLHAFPTPILVDDEAGYWIRSHPDTPTKIVTLQIYLPEDDSHPEMGTELLGATVKPLEFLANTGFAFHPTNQTNHQVREGICHHRRRSLQLIYYNSARPNISYLNDR